MGKNWAGYGMILIRDNEAGNQVTKEVERLTGWLDGVILKRKRKREGTVACAFR